MSHTPVGLCRGLGRRTIRQSIDWRSRGVCALTVMHMQLDWQSWQINENNKVISIMFTVSMCIYIYIIIYIYIYIYIHWHTHTNQGRCCRANGMPWWPRPTSSRRASYSKLPDNTCPTDSPESALSFHRLGFLGLSDLRFFRRSVLLLLPVVGLR